MKNIISIFFILFFISCSTEPQPLVVGKDECYFCKMPVADTKFGAEIITVKGKLYKFDDAGCIINFLKIGLSPDEKIKNIFTVSYSTNQKFLDVSKSFFLMSENFRTPMNSGIASFETRNEAEAFLKKFPGEILTWNQLQQKLK
jgi:copper chaperone NosL